VPPLATALERRLSPWAWLVTGSAVIVVGALLTLAAWGLATRERRVTTYAIRGNLDEVDLDLAAADAEIVGGARAGVRQSERFAFGHRARVRRTVANGVLSIRSRCPTTVLHSCAASYRVTVPDNVPVVVRTGQGDVALSGLRAGVRIITRGGNVNVRGYCGFSRQARAESGDVSADLACAPEDMTLRSSTGSVRAIVPPGRYRLDADTDAGRRTVRGLASDPNAPFAIQALSSSGDVTVEARR
jgi:Putative adhesin